MNNKNNDNNNANVEKTKNKKNTLPSDVKQENYEVKKTSFLFKMIPFFFGVGSLLLLACLIFTESSGIFGSFVTSAFYGLFSIVSWIFPVLLMLLALCWHRDHKNNVLKRKVFSSIAVIILLSCINYYITYMSLGGQPDNMSPVSVWNMAQSVNGFKYGGIFGCYLGWLIVKIFSTVGTPIILGAALTVFVVFLFNIPPETLGRFFKNTVKFVWSKIVYFFKFLWKKIFKKRDKKKVYINKPSKTEANATADTTSDNVDEKQKEITDDTAVKTQSAVAPEKKAAEPGEDHTEVLNPINQKKDKDTIDLDSIFSYNERELASGSSGTVSSFGSSGNPVSSIYVAPENDADVSRTMPVEAPDSLTIKVKPLMATGFEGEEIPQKEYVFPPIEYLQPKPVTQEDIDYIKACNELGQRLVNVLKTFKVSTRLVNVSVGPTITRFELAPEEGVKVKQIANLADDIQLNLAAKAPLRIEAPIMGKSAVGIEVPSLKRKTVFLSELIDNETFTKQKSKLTAALGIDVGGEPVYMNITELPHLIIAGTTGSGKSVCMNCIILSLLYRATPDELKFVMIDPKQVEFAPYNGLPHLVVPVVSDAKKAAGALSWATNEMERRYSLIREACVKDIDSYNAKTANDEGVEYLPRLVIFIDELADLMMQAKDTVENSICRIAQKGRACGIHLIIGTQRPSVDVITGLIKANVPSRIAFQVSSQVDSRTIIDFAGAETLIGKGDMLYQPITNKKNPIRVQGGFVTDSEVDNITKFIEQNNNQPAFDEGVLNEIESEAEKCAAKSKKGALDDDEDSGDINGNDYFADEKFEEAVDIAIAAGKIATSQLQRRLQVGYGRAAKMIDAMETLKIVGPPDGQRARTVLMSKTEWEEYRMSLR